MSLSDSQLTSQGKVPLKVSLRTLTGVCHPSNRRAIQWSHRYESKKLKHIHTKVSKQPKEYIHGIVHNISNLYTDVASSPTPVMARL